MQDKFL